MYNENGLRVQKSVNGVVTKYTLHGKNIHHMTKGSDELHFFYDAQNKPAIVVFNGVPYSYVKNLQGDIVAILDSNKNVVVKYVYDAWGHPISKTGSMAGTLGTVQPFRYRGYVYDEETGLYYVQSRYYSPDICRFMNSDAFVSHNLYIYCNNSPLSRVDPSGCSSSTITPYASDGIYGAITKQSGKSRVERLRSYVKWPSKENVARNGKVHLEIHYQDYNVNENVLLLSGAELYDLSYWIGHELERRYGFDFETIDIRQMKGEIAFHIYGYALTTYSSTTVIDLDIYPDGAVRDSRPWVNSVSSLFK